MIKDAVIDEIKSRMDIYDVVSDFVQLKRAGSSYKALSPFTDEKTPSFVVTPNRNIFKCFSTGKGGDAIAFVMEMDGLSYVEALRYLAKKYAIDLEEEEATDEQKKAQSERESLFITLKFAKDHFVKNLWETDEGKNIGLTYFKERGFSEETIRTFDMGYAKDQWQGLMEAASEDGYQTHFLQKAGLIISNEQKTYDRFRGRVIFPIHNITGKVIAFGARALKKDEKGPKYLNSPETDLYTKSKILYGIFQAKNEIRNQANCYLVEGYTDVVSMVQAGIKNVVASSGTSLTEEQITLIRRYSENVTVLFDGDKAGIKASMRGIDMMLKGDLKVRAVPFPEGEDPDSYSRKLGGAAFKEYLEAESKDFITFKTDLYLSDGKDDPLAKAESIQEIVNSIALIPKPIDRVVYIQQCSKLLGVDESILNTEVNKLVIKEHQDQQKKAAVVAKSAPVALPTESLEQQWSKNDIIKLQEGESIRMLINYGEKLVEDLEMSKTSLVQYFLQESEDIEFTTPVYDRILQLFRSSLQEGILLSSDDLLSHEDQQIKTAATDLVAEKYEISKNWSEKFQIHVKHEKDNLKKATFDNILRLKFRIVQKMIADNLEKIKSANGEKEENEVLDMHCRLKEIEQSIAEKIGNVTVK